MRNVTYTTKNGNTYTSYEKAMAEDKYATINLSASYDAEKPKETKKMTEFGVFTGKMAKDWKGKETND